MKSDNHPEPVVKEFTTEINVGFLGFGQLRDALDSYAWSNTSLTWKEGRGWLDRTFYVKGPENLVRSIAKRFAGFASRVERVL